MLIERCGAKRSHGDITLARARAQLVHADGSWAIFMLQGRYGVPDGGTTHKYRIDLSRDEVLEALQEMLSGSNHPKLSKPVCTMLRELLTPKK